MKYTEKLGLGLFEKTDKVSYKPINENMEAIEEAIGAQDERITDEVAAVMAAMGSGGATARVAYGNWTGTGAMSRTLTFAFTPVLVLITAYDGGSGGFAVRGAMHLTENATTNLEWGDKYLKLFWYSINTPSQNMSGMDYYYVAIGV